MKRLVGIASRGGSIMAKWCLAQNQENFLVLANLRIGSCRDHEGWLDSVELIG